MPDPLLRFHSLGLLFENLEDAFTPSPLMTFSAKRSQCFLQPISSVSSAYDPAACPQTTFPFEICDLPCSATEATKPARPGLPSDPNGLPDSPFPLRRSEDSIAIWGPVAGTQIPLMRFVALQSFMNTGVVRLLG